MKIINLEGNIVVELLTTVNKPIEITSLTSGCYIAEITNSLNQVSQIQFIKVK